MKKKQRDTMTNNIITNENSLRQTNSFHLMVARTRISSSCEINTRLFGSKAKKLPGCLDKTSFKKTFS